MVRAGKLVLGNLEARRDWGAAVDSVRAMQLILAHPDPDDFVIGTGKMRSVGDLCEIAYGSLGLDWRSHVTSDPRLLRPAETGPKVADAGKATARLGWRAETTIESVLVEMTQRDLSRLGPLAHRQAGR